MNSGGMAVASGKQQPELQIAQKKAIAEETQVGEGEGRHRRERERQRDGEKPRSGANCRAPANSGSRSGYPNSSSTARRAAGAERMGLQVAEILEAVQRRREDRNEHDARKHDERAEERDAR